MGRPKKRIIPVRKCLHCGKELEDKNFYKSNSFIYIMNDKYIPVCKDCVKSLFKEYKIKYTNQFSALKTELQKNAIEKLAMRRICMMFDVYYSDNLYKAALKNQEKFPNSVLITAYFRILNLRQSKNKTYDTTIAEEDLSQELLKSSMVNKIVEKFENDSLYQDIYDLYVKLMQSLKKELRY